MFPYHANSDALLPPPALPSLTAELVFPLAWDRDAVFAVAAPSRRSGDRRSLGAFGDGLGETLASNVFFGAGFATGFGVTFGFGLGVALRFGAGVGRGVALGVGDANSISLFDVVIEGFSSSSATSTFDGSGATGGGVTAVAADDGPFFG